MDRKKFYIITNRIKDPDRLITSQIMSYLEGLGMLVRCQDPQEDLRYTKYRYTNAEQIDKDTDCILVLGGDGTLIQAARDLHHLNIPMLGVNIGTLGFLTDTDKDHVFQALAQFMEGKYEIDRRMMLQGQIFRDDRLLYENSALNDIVVNRCGNLRIIDFDIYVNGQYLNSYTADGVIVSTATGSTAYSLSAGGPIIQPNAELLMITPICPHTLNPRSIIFSAEDEIEIRMSNNKGLSEEQRVATFDGESSCQVITGDRLLIRRSSETSVFVKTSQISFLQRIRNKM